MKSILKDHLKNKIIQDIFLIGSSLKNKLYPEDVDIVVLFREKNKEIVSETLFSIKEELSFLESVHLESIYSDNLFSETLLLTILSEGFSIKNDEFVSKEFNLNSGVIFSYNLTNLSSIDKVRFSQALFGRNKDGLLPQHNGQVLGQGSFFVPILDEEIFIDLFEKWKINYKRRRAFINN